MWNSVVSNHTCGLFRKEMKENIVHYYYQSLSNVTLIKAIQIIISLKIHNPYCVSNTSCHSLKVDGELKNCLDFWHLDSRQCFPLVCNHDKGAILQTNSSRFSSVGHSYVKNNMMTSYRKVCSWLFAACNPPALGAFSMYKVRSWTLFL